MLRIGRVIHITPSRKAVVKAESLPKIGDKVFNEKKRFVGTVFDLIGPVSSPYISVKPEVKDPNKLINHVLYVFPSKKRRRFRKR